jgi:Leucine-rich repeat (LRR) protein
MKNLVLICLLVCCKSFFAQRSDSAQYKKVYTSITEAYKEPLKVYRLNLSNLPIDSFPIKLSQFKNLQHLYLNYDHLEFIPTEIADLENLRVLQLCGDNFKTLPPEFSRLKNLEEIYLNVNKKIDLTQSVKVMSSLPKLHVLHLENDGIVALPGNFSMLTHLEKLYLNDNKLTEVPQQLKDVKTLKYVEIQNNSFSPYYINKYKTFGVKIKF